MADVEAEVVLVLIMDDVADEESVLLAVDEAVVVFDDSPVLEALVDADDVRDEDAVDEADEVAVVKSLVVAEEVWLLDLVVETVVVTEDWSHSAKVPSANELTASLNVAIVDMQF